METAGFLGLGPETDTSLPPHSVVQAVAKPTGPESGEGDTTPPPHPTPPLGEGRGKDGGCGEPPHGGPARGLGYGIAGRDSGRLTFRPR